MPIVFSASTLLVIQAEIVAFTGSMHLPLPVEEKLTVPVVGRLDINVDTDDDIEVVIVGPIPPSPSPSSSP
jgi:hypothetical protein